MKTYLVTGSQGYLGQALIEYLCRQTSHEPCQIFGLSRHGNPNAQGWRSIEGDILHPDLPLLLEEIQPDIIFHFAAANPLTTFETQLQVNVLGTRHLLQSLVESQQSPVVVVPGSALEYGAYKTPVSETTPPRPQGDPGTIKLAQTMIAQSYYHQYGLPVLVGRLFQVYGQNYQDPILAPILSQIVRYEIKEMHYPKIRIRNPLCQRDWLHVHDVIRAFEALSLKGQPGEIYNIASNQAVSTQTVLKTLLEYTPFKQTDIETVEENSASGFSQGLSVKISQDTGWHPTLSLEEGLKRELLFWHQKPEFLGAQDLRKSPLVRT